MHEVQKHITLSQLAARVGDALRSALGGEVWTVAEISQCSVGSAGHCYLNLVERDEGASALKAEFRAAIWAGKYKMIESYFLSSTGSRLAAGMKVLIRVSLNYHPTYGISLVISDIDPTYTVGETERKRQQTIERLKKEGLWDLQREFALPIVAQRFAVVSSATAAGFEDFLKQISDSPYKIDVELFAALMQGTETAQSVVAALSKIETRARDFDAVIIIRGGGSTSDLSWFDAYDICRAVAQFPLPVLTGIGHEKDTSIADMVAYHSFKTPTAVASGLVDRLATIDSRIENMRDSLVSLSTNRLLVENSRLDKAAHTLGRLTSDALKGAALRLEKSSGAILSTAASAIERRENQLLQHKNSIGQLASAFLDRQRATLTLMAERIDGRNPRRILKMGYAIVKLPTGGSLKSTYDAPRGTILDIELTDGTIKTEVQ